MRYFAVSVLILFTACAAGKLKTFNAPEDQYVYAKQLYDKGDYISALDAFQTVIFRFHGTSLADSVTYYMGMSYYNQKEYALAIGEFKRLLANYPSSPLADDAQYLISKSYFLDAPKNVGLEQEGIKDAIQSLESFQEDFPNSGFRQNARDLLDSCYGRQAQKDYRNGEIYFKIGDYKAARIYLELVVTKYSSPEWVGKALFRLAEIDLKEKSYFDARSKLNNFAKAFPEHPWFEKARKLLVKVEADYARADSSEKKDENK